MSDLNTKLKSMNEEKQILALRILQEKEISKENGNQKSIFTKVQAKSSKQHFPEIPTSVLSSPLNNTDKLQRNNMYDILTIEDHDETIADDDQEITRQVSNTQEVAVGNDERFTANGQSKEDGQQHTKKGTVSQTTEKVNVSVNSECSEENGHGSNQTTKQYTLTIGDSMIKHINLRKLSKSLVRKSNFPGKRAEEIMLEINGIKSTSSSPSKVIIHAGTNNLPADSSKQCCDNIKNLCTAIQNKFPDAKIGVSGLVNRKDIDVPAKISETNDLLKDMCKQRGHTFINNSNLDGSCLNGSNLHLNPKGSTSLAVNFIRFLREGQAPPNHYNHSNQEDFQLGTLHHLVELLKVVSVLILITNRLVKVW